MSDENQSQPNSPQDSPDESPSSESEKKSPTDKLKSFLTLGGDKKAQRKVLLVTAMVLILFGMGTFMAWGMAVAMTAFMRGEPSGGTVSGSFGVIKTMEVNITMYSPVIGSNTCDGPISMGGGAATSDGKGSFIFEGGKIKWKSKTKLLDHIFAQPSDDPIISWDKINDQAIQIPSFLSDQPIEIHDHYAPGNHNGENFLDLSYTCGEGAELQAELKAIQKQQGLSGGKEGGILIKVNVVEYGASGTTVDRGKLSTWYYNQGGDSNRGGGYWGPKPGQCGGWSVNSYASRGCALTSAAMIARYYGKNFDPYKIGGRMCSANGQIGLDIGVVARILEKSYKGISNPSVDNVKSSLKNGPILAQGDRAFGASGQHWVVIVAIEGDKVIINDPTVRSVGGSGKEWSTSEISKLRNIYYFY